MEEIKWKAPLSVYKELNNIVGDINKSVEGRKSKNLHNLFTSSKKLAIKLNERLNPLVERVSILFLNYSADVSFGKLCVELDNRLKSWGKELGISVRINVPNKKPVYQIIKENLYETKKVLNSITVQANEKNESMQKWKKNLDKVATKNKKNLKEISKLFEDAKNKNSVIVEYIQTFTIVKEEDKQYLLKSEINSVESLSNNFRLWSQKFGELIKKVNEFLSRVKNYDVNKIKSDTEVKISNFLKQTEQNVSKMNISINECAKLCNGKLEWNEIQRQSSELVAKAKACILGGKSVDVAKMAENISDTIDKEYNILVCLKISIDEYYNSLIALYSKIQTLTSKLEPLQQSLENRIRCKRIYVFDKNSSPKDKSKLQDVFDIVYNKKDIIKPNYIPYIIGHAEWVLVDGNLKEVKVMGINTPYKEKAELQKKLREIYK